MKVARTTFPHAPTTAPTVAVVLLAGGMRHSPLRQQLGVPSLCLPLSHDRTLLDHWLSTAEALPQCRSVVIAVSGAEDAETIRKAVAARNRSIAALHVDVQVVIEPATWRGPAGLLYDLVQSGRCGEPGEAGRVVVAGEASCLPPDDLEALIECLNRTSPGVSVTSRSGQPAGLYALSDQALQMIPSIGFYDIKEQLLPAMYSRGTPVQAMRTQTETVRLWDRSSYLDAVRALQSRGSARDEASSHGEGAIIEDTARLAGCCLIDRGAKVCDDAIVHESIVLCDAVIGQGAVVSNSVIGPGVTVQPGAVVKRAVLGSTTHRMSRPALRGLSEMFGLRTLWRGEGVS